jgi:hypothetical protein
MNRQKRCWLSLNKTKNVAVAGDEIKVGREKKTRIDQKMLL